MTLVLIRCTLVGVRDGPGLALVGPVLGLQAMGLAPMRHRALFVAVAPIVSAVKARQAFSASLATQHPAILDAREFLSDAKVPPGSAVIAEDELLNYVLVKRPDYFTQARSIQSFNVMTDTQRREALSKAQFLYVSSGETTAGTTFSTFQERPGSRIDSGQSW